MNNYCYNCGAAANDGDFCEQCGTQIEPPYDLYCNAQTCEDDHCKANVPRWGKFCPVCGKAQRGYDPSDEYANRTRNRGLVLGALVWTAICCGAALLISTFADGIPISIALIVAGVLSVGIWVFTLRSFERGKTVEGTVVRHWTAEEYESVVVPNEKSLLGFRYFRKQYYTAYKTEIRWDDGRTETHSMRNCAANHIQLKPGDRVFKYLSTGQMFKID